MKKTIPASAIFKLLLKGSLVILVVGCGSSQVSIGEQNADGSAGGAAGRVDAPVSSAGAKAGGSSAVAGNGGSAGEPWIQATRDSNAGGVSANGGTGGASASGGTDGTATGGTTGTSSSTRRICSTNKTCGAGEFCDYPVGSCGEGNTAGACVTNASGCIAPWQPVCGCDGQTYSNDCERLMVGVLKRSDGECVKSDSGVSDAASSEAALCTATGGEVKTQSCCTSVGDFPNLCSIGACSCGPSSSHSVSVCNCSSGCFVPGVGCFN